MLTGARERILATVPDDAPVLDVGGWGRPLHRATHVLDLMPYETRGLYGEPDPGPERFTAATWVQRDMCDKEPWPFADGEFAFAVCSHTLEDVRDPVHVCRELQRVARAGYLEVPSRAEEQTYGIQGPWVGWGHHHWLCDVRDGGIDFVFKHAIVAREGLHRRTPPAERVQQLWWEGAFEVRERLFYEAAELESYLAEVVGPEPPAGRRARLRRLLGR
jgi:ubiquinone/menaquinone biosynthesis C-methylase UbiE